MQQHCRRCCRLCSDCAGCEWWAASGLRRCLRILLQWQLPMRAFDRAPTRLDRAPKESSSHHPRGRCDRRHRVAGCVHPQEWEMHEESRCCGSPIESGRRHDRRVDRHVDRHRACRMQTTMQQRQLRGGELERPGRERTKRSRREAWSMTKSHSQPRASALRRSCSLQMRPMQRLVSPHLPWLPPLWPRRLAEPSQPQPLVPS